VAAKRGGGAGGGARKAPARRAPGAPLTNKQIIGRVVAASFLVFTVIFAVQGGEYGTTDLIRQRRQITRERAVVDSLEKAVGELKLLKKAVESDPATQERIAREEFGMVKGDKEILYRFTDTLAADSTR
jgi:cell division protein FtsB